MMNALFVLIVFLLQLNKGLLHVKWPFGVKTNITYDEVTQEVRGKGALRGLGKANRNLFFHVVFPTRLATLVLGDSLSFYKLLPLVLSSVYRQESPQIS